MSAPTCGELSCDECNARTAALTAERDQLRLDCDNETKWAAHYLAQSIADKARAERAEDNLAALEQSFDDNCRGVVRIADDLSAATAEVARLKRDYEYDHKCLHEVRERCESWKQRAERAEADAAAYFQRANSFSKIGDEAEAELATERARLDWVFQNCKVEANDYTTGNRDVYYVHDREDLGAAMKEDAK